MGVTQKWWDRDKHAVSDPNSKDGVRHYSEAEIEDYKSKVIEALKKHEIKGKDAEALFQKYTAYLDEVLANDSPEDFAELIACDYDGNKTLSEIVPAFVGEMTIDQIQNDSKEDLERSRKKQQSKRRSRKKQKNGSTSSDLLSGSVSDEVIQRHFTHKILNRSSLDGTSPEARKQF